MKMFPTLLLFALSAAQASATPSSESCSLRMSEDGNFVTLQGVVDPQIWPRGTYDMTMEVQQGSNKSLSRQAGAFGEGSAFTDGFLVLSSTTVYVADGGRLTVTLSIEDGNRNASCSLDYER
ncbi:hypothetical protein SAMN05421666_1384 [Roseovarius nanhaiticus]|uniref:Uncharacterized protein n=1 Tax=Roseovarius nanhaiticus TaxID=573024 RepID=A0A1N7FUV8_9RHOB|nr:curli-like amyloid fiber formation chaperone CsgH [Roseovarius nanhaiticus]SEK45029.1 hypothetical protein SAMN05216208_0752 [Roseovarius nanhaiticus]SIS04005.1 hypothetical protein SAMN05421666_1384 [Roseovarius nanhaiticus]